MAPFRRLGWALLAFGAAAAGGGLLLAEVQKAIYLYAISLGPPALLVGIAMVVFPGGAKLDPGQSVVDDWEALWQQVRVAHKLVWLVALCLGVMGSMGVIFVVLEG